MSDEEKLSITVKHPAHDAITISIKKSTKFSKVFDAVASRIGVAASSIRFLYDGKRVTKDDTAKMLEMEEGDQIDALTEQTGGGEVYSYL